MSGAVEATRVLCAVCFGVRGIAAPTRLARLARLARLTRLTEVWRQHEPDAPLINEW